MTHPALAVDRVPDIGTAILRQSTYWRTRGPDGHLEVIRLDSMSWDHQRRALAWLRAHADQMRHHEARTLGGAYKAGRIEERDLCSGIAWLRWGTPAVEWIEDTPLVRRLVQLAPPEPVAPKIRRRLPARLMARWSR